ncbi:DNA/RNA helicase domain-containing protein, partial [Eubacteriales bacterium SGI.150]
MPYRYCYLCARKGQVYARLCHGVPGAGKTYLGLQYVYESFQAAEQVHSVYLSGNGPLVKVLSAALGSNVFV